MAKELAHFENFAKLQDTSLAFNDITVLAGKPGTGKSYVMKMMYALDEGLFLLEKNIEKMSKHNKDIEFKLKSLEKLLDELEDLKDEEKTLQNTFLRERMDEINKLSEKNNYLFEDNLPFDHIYQNKVQNLLNSIFLNIDQISDNFVMSKDFLTLRYEESKLVIDEKEQDNNLNKKDENQEIIAKEVIFVETPLILEFKSFMSREKGKTPYHIESLLNILDTDYSFTDEEQDKFIETFTKKSKEIIQGDIESSGDSFIFKKEGDKSYDIINASSGTKSIGLLQYLVTNKALKKGSVLYWEEPEVHLHPEWQLRMVDLFVELMNAGVKIVFSTHSPYMADYLNAISQREKFDDRVSFNLFKETDGVVENYILDSDEKWNMIQDELLGSLEEIMWQYL